MPAKLFWKLGLIYFGLLLAILLAVNFYSPRKLFAASLAILVLGGLFSLI